DANGNLVGSGIVAFAGTTNLPVAISGNVAYSIAGNGTLSVYDLATNNLGVSANWQNYAATLSGSIVLQVSTGSLQLNGRTLAPGTYTITAPSASLRGSGLGSSPDFSGNLKVQATNSTVDASAGSGSARVGPRSLDPTNAFTLDGFTGTATVAEGPSSESVM